MIDPEELLRDLPNDEDEAIVEIIKRFIAANQQDYLFLSRSEDNIALLGTALSEFEAFDRMPELAAALGAKSDGVIGNELSRPVQVYESRLVQSRQQTALNQAKDKIRETIRIRRDTNFGYARLSLDERRLIHDSLNKIREIIDQSSIDERKKNALLDRLNDLTREIDRAGTRMDGFVAVWVDIWFAFGAGVKAAKPVFDELKDILKILYQSRAREEQTSLPLPQDILRLPAPGGDE